MTTNKFTHVARPVRVNAIQIAELLTKDARGGISVRTVDDVTHYLPAEMMARYSPIVGDYIVTQEDGYVYLNPRDVFERKYQTIEA